MNCTLFDFGNFILNVKKYCHYSLSQNAFFSKFPAWLFMTCSSYKLEKNLIVSEERGKNIGKAVPVACGDCFAFEFPSKNK